MAIAYFEDSLRTPLESLFYVGPGGAIGFDATLNQPDSGRTSDPDSRPRRTAQYRSHQPGAPWESLAGVTGALAN